MAIYANLFIDQGADFKSSINLQSVNGLAFNGLDHVIKAQMRKTYSSSRSVDFYTEWGDQLNGVAVISLTSEQTAGLKSGRYVYDVEITSTATGEKFRVIEGQVEVSPRVSRDGPTVNIDGGSASSSYGNYNVVLDGGPA